MAIVNVLPVDDLREHSEDSACECRPRIEIVEGGMIIVHHAWDNREIIDQAKDIIGDNDV